MDEKRRAKRGLAVRRAVLGPEHVERTCAHGVLSTTNSRIC